MNKYKSAAVLCLLALSCACLTTGCGKKHREKIELTNEQSAAAPETMAPEKESTDSASAEGTDDNSADLSGNGQGHSSGASTTGSAAPKISTEIHTYTSGKVSIQYPSVLNLDNSGQTAAIDALLKKNALSILDAWKVNDAEDSLTVTCQVLSADRSRITAIYTGTVAAKGAAHPTNIFYSNTVNVRSASDMTFTDFAAPYTMAGYVLSDDCTFYHVSEEQKSELMKAKNELTLEQYTDLFQHADFPIKAEESAAGSSLSAAFGFPGSFSYEHEGTIFFSIPVAHALGDYAIVAYTPETK